jgi:hypothetical protein
MDKELARITFCQLAINFNLNKLKIDYFSDLFTDAIDIYFRNKNINKIKFVNQVKGTLYPMNQIPANLQLLKGFNWNESVRPKNKFAIFE